MKVKMFTNMGDAPKLETEINDWLDNNNNIEIKHIKQNYACDNKGDMFYSLLSTWYEDSK
ncbi:MAG: hypothetical protein JRJ44_06480 [Deltaproteobacteria bacterium]|nr:hypothetical protein [Deltaproteobacteria bacterium]